MGRSSSCRKRSPRTTAFIQAEPPRFRPSRPPNLPESRQIDGSRVRHARKPTSSAVAKGTVLHHRPTPPPRRRTRSGTTDNGAPPPLIAPSSHRRLKPTMDLGGHQIRSRRHQPLPARAMEAAVAAAHPGIAALNAARAYLADAAPAASTDHRHVHPPSTIGVGARRHCGCSRRQRRRGRRQGKGRFVAARVSPWRLPGERREGKGREPTTIG